MSIRIITEPTVYLVGTSAATELVGSFLGDQGVPGWRSDAPSDPEFLAEVAGRLCYESFVKPRPGGNEAYIEHILESGHGSVLEHATFNLIFTGVSRSLTHELVRHRAGMSYSQLSQRFVDESDVAFVVPPLILRGRQGYQASQGELPMDDAERASWQAYHQWYGSCLEAVETYRSLVEKLDCQLSDIPDKTLRCKRAREAARSVLPNCAETKIFVTGNGRSLRHLVELRGDIGADAEIRRLAVAVLGVLRKASPNIFGDYITNAEGSISTTYRKV